MKTTIPTVKLPPIKKWPNASITLPAAAPPVWPSVSTTRVDATLSDRRSMVDTSKMVGKAMKSSGLTVYRAVSSTITDSAMLKLKNTSSTKAGSGSIIIASSKMMIIGAASALPPLLARPLIQAGSWMLFMLLLRCSAQACARPAFFARPG